MSNTWKRIRGTAGSPAWKRGDIVVEVFQDSSWKNDNANVIVYDGSQESYESAFGKVIHVDCYNTKAQALRAAEAYMKNN